MLDKTQDQEETELWHEANNPPEKTYDFFGKIEIKLFKGAYETGTRGAVPYNPATHEKGHTIVKIYIDPLPEINVKYTNQLEYESPVWAEWGKITYPSIKALGIDNAHEVNGMFARVARVPSGKKYPKKDKATGQLTGEMGDETTFKFVEFFTGEDECRAAYIAAGGQPVTNGNNESTPAPATSESENMLNFMKVIINKNVMKDMTLDEAKAVISSHQSYPVLSKFYTVESDEVLNLIGEIVLPF